MLRTCALALVLLSGCGSDDSDDGGSDAGRGGSAGVAGDHGATGGAAGNAGTGGSAGGAARGGSGAGAGSGGSDAGAGGSTAGSGGASSGSGGASGGGAMTGEARGAVSLHIAPGDDCSLSDSWVDFPALASGHPVTDTAHEPLLENGTRDENGWTVQVVCEWLSEEDPYFVSLAIGLIGDDDQRLVSMSPLLSVGSQQEGTMTFSDSESTPRFAGAADSPCQFEGVSLDVTGGTVWGRLVCASVIDDDSGEECVVSEGYFYFENCVPKEP